MGNRGAIAAGDVQWMTAGSGIIHQEMPKGDAAGRMHGFQLWANLPSSLKMTAPRYQEVKTRDIPEVTDDDGTHVRIVCGTFWGKTGPVDGIAADPIYLDVSVPPGRAQDAAGRDDSARVRLCVRGRREVLQRFRAARRSDRGRGMGRTPQPPADAENRSLVVFDRGDEVSVQAGEDGIRFLLVSGKPLEEPVAWYGPIVMNTQQELQQAFQRTGKRNVPEKVRIEAAKTHERFP